MADVALLAGLLAAAVIGTAVACRGPIVRRVTRRRGAPHRTTGWEPFPPDDQPAVHLVVAGDVGDGGPPLRAMAAAVAALDADQPLDGLVLLGDHVYPRGDPARLADTVFGPFAAVLDHVPLHAVLGNHDVMRRRAAAQMAALGMPGRWWVRHLAEVLLVGLDSNLAGDAEQRAWLDRTLAGATEPWRIVVVHHPPFSAGYQGSDRATRDAFTPLFARHGVQLVLAGHDHDYQRSVPIDGVTYVVTGGAARTRRTGADDFTAVSFGWHHITELAVWPDRLVLRAIDPDRRVADEVVLHP